ncbi:MAG TPA: trypsin-like peptidase domain-containing protein [Geobacterales bacterium]|nr:trypsin-like peptidase domain-containing protein [Geobacterales bacterium]
MRRASIVLLLLFLAAPFSLFAQESSETSPLLPKRVLDLVSDAVFEVVVEKPATDPLQYERPLPLELLPYSQRTSKYLPIGSAFAIGPDRFVSAVHVLSPGSRTQYKGIYLRDRDGKVYPIDKVLKYSRQRDMILFSLKGRIAKKFFETNSKPALNQRVFAVGNALGEGIVIRDGLYTSATPEEDKGEWNYIRFSAAASPGNSGGPLLDRDGRVIGIILGKSENENLNYALPIGELLNAPTNKAIHRLKGVYRIANMDMTHFSNVTNELPLPMSYADFHQQLIAINDKVTQQMMSGFFTEHKAEIFPEGKDSLPLLYKLSSVGFPRLIMRDRDGSWDAYAPEDTSSTKLERNGELTYGGLASYLFLKLDKPDNVTLATLTTDNKLLMDTVLKGLALQREIGPEKIAITSLGQAADVFSHTDRWGRRWLVRTWLIPHTDEKIALFLLPLPGGMAGFLKAADTSDIDGDYLQDMKALTDFIYLSYYGSLANWREFLALGELRPKAFDSIAIDFDYGHRFSYRSPDLSFSYDAEQMAISERSDLQLLFSFFPRQGKVVWDVAGVVAGEDKATITSFAIHRKPAPPAELPDTAQTDWQNLVNHRYPFNNEAWNKDGDTLIRTIWPEKVSGTPKLLYTIGYDRQGNVKQREMERNLQRFIKGIRVELVP